MKLFHNLSHVISVAIHKLGIRNETKIITFANSGRVSSGNGFKGFRGEEVVSSLTPGGVPSQGKGS